MWTCFSEAVSSSLSSFIWPLLCLTAHGNNGHSYSAEQDYQHPERCALNKAALLPILQARIRAVRCKYTYIYIYTHVCMCRRRCRCRFMCMCMCMCMYIMLFTGFKLRG